MTSALAPFDRHRRLLFAVAYQMLGSVADAEDVVQDAWLRWSAADRTDVADERAYLVQIATRLALDRLGSARARRETYVGPWLPEPLLTGGPAVGSAPPAAAPDEAAELGEQVSLALLVVLETLTPNERAVFVLREVFGLPVAEVAAVIGRSEAAVRQTAHRARAHVEARRPRFDVDRSAQREATERFLDAASGGDIEALLAVLAPDVVLVSDGGGKARAALRPIAGADKVARFVLGVSAQGLTVPDLRVEVADVNGGPAIVAWQGTDPFLAMSMVLAEDGRIDQVLVVRNPDKLRGLSARDDHPVGGHWHPAPMPDDAWQDLVERSRGGDVGTGTMFGSAGLRTGKKFFAIWWHEQLVVKLPSDRREELVAAGQAEPFEPMEGRPMNGWVVLHDGVQWDPVVAEARAWVESPQ